MKSPPTDRNGELRRAMLALERCRREITVKAELPVEWQRWVAQALVDGLATDPAIVEAAVRGATK